METQGNSENLQRFFVKSELIPVICQDERTGEVLMLGVCKRGGITPHHGNGYCLVFLAVATDVVE